MFAFVSCLLPQLVFYFVFKFVISSIIRNGTRLTTIQLARHISKLLLLFFFFSLCCSLFRLYIFHSRRHVPPRRNVYRRTTSDRQTRSPSEQSEINPTRHRLRDQLQQQPSREKREMLLQRKVLHAGRAVRLMMPGLGDILTSCRVSHYPLEQTHAGMPRRQGIRTSGSVRYGPTTRPDEE